MLDQASLKLLLRTRAELSAAMLLAGKRVRQKQDQEPAVESVRAARDEPGAIRIKMLAATTRS